MVKKSTKPLTKTYLLYLPAVLGFCMYLLTLNHGFVLDDNLVLTQNSHVKEGIPGIPALLSSNYAHGHQSFNDGLYRPISLVTFAIEQSLFSLNPKASHFIQALLYGLLLIALMRWLKTWLNLEDWTLFFILLLFAAHPLHTEVVANLKSRDELLALLFFSVAALQFSKWLEVRRSVHIFASAFLYLLALFSKESAITFVAIFPLMAWYRSGSIPLDAIKSSAIFIAPAALFLVVRHLVLLDMGPVDDGITNLLQNPLASSQSWSERIATAALLQGFYIIKLFAPLHLSHDYSYNSLEVVGFSSPWAWLAALVVMALLLMAWKGIQRRSAWSFGIWFYFITIAVVANLFVMIGALAAERFAFTPSLGWSIAVVSASTLLPKSYGKWGMTALALVFTFLTINRIPDWESNFTLFSADVSSANQSARMHYNYGTACNEEAQKGGPEAALLRADAIKHLEEAISIWPEYRDAYNNLGVVYIDLNQLEDAYRIYTNTYEQFPDYNKGLYNLAVTSYKLKRYDEAEIYFEAYYERSSSNDVLYMMAETEGYLSKFDEAIAHLSVLVQREPTNPRGFLKLGMAYLITGNLEQGEAYLKTAARMNPNDAEIQYNLALMYLNTERVNEAKECLKNAVTIDPDHTQARSVLERL
jgi:tetratricopeptide (TPR) repeat protein